MLKNYYQMHHLDKIAVGQDSIEVPGLAFPSGRHIQNFFYVTLLTIQLSNVETSYVAMMDLICGSR